MIRFGMHSAALFLLTLSAAPPARAQRPAAPAAAADTEAPEADASSEADSQRSSATPWETQRLSQWHQWRGPLADGVAPQADPPVEWDATRNLRWSAALEGEGASTPIVWQGRVFVLSARDTGRPAAAPTPADPRAKTRPTGTLHEFLITCLDLETGRRLWQQTAVTAAPREGRHETHTYAAASPTTDGRRLYVSFGSRGIFCYSLDGERLWRRDLGEMRTRYGWGEAVSPVISGDYLIVNWDHEDDSFLYALDAATGATRWRCDRPDEPTSWATPLVAPSPDGLQVVVQGTGRVRGYDLETGAVRWRAGGQTINAIPSPLPFRQTAICMSGYRGQAARAIPLDARGDLEEDAFVWRYDRNTPYVPSPVLLDGRLYFTKSNQAILTCLDAESGEPRFEGRRLEALDSLYASPLAASGRLYFVGRNGVTIVLQADDDLSVLAVNRLGDPIDASPVAVGPKLLLRGRSRVYCFQK